MRDEDFDYFISKFGEPTHRQDVPASSIDAWRGKLPDQLLRYWAQEGWCGYGEGLFWSVNPDDYEDIIDEWLDGSQVDGLDSFHVVARTAFGSLYVCGQRCGTSLTILTPIHAIVALESDLNVKDAARLDLEIRTLFGGRRLTNCDLKDEDGKPLFRRAIDNLGSLDPDEMYGFEPALVAGGRMRLENLQRVKTDQHLTLLRQLAPARSPFDAAAIERLRRKL